MLEEHKNGRHDVKIETKQNNNIDKFEISHSIDLKKRTICWPMKWERKEKEKICE